MSESTTRAYARQTYTIDLSGLLAHARDTFRLHAAPALSRTAEGARSAVRAAVGAVSQARTGPPGSGHERHGIPDSVRIR